jgi:putative resolvase
MKISIGKAAAELGVTRETLRRWETAGKITSSRTPKGHRRYDLYQLRGVVPQRVSQEKRTVAYARVSSHNQKDDLARQAAALEAYCASQGWKFEVIHDLGSGLNYSKKGRTVRLGASTAHSRIGSKRLPQRCPRGSSVY